MTHPILTPHKQTRDRASDKARQRVCAGKQLVSARASSHWRTWAHGGLTGKVSRI